jgi:F like protein
MKAARLLSITHDFRARILRVEAAAVSVLEDAHRHTVAKIQPALDRLSAQLQDKRDAGEDIPVSWLYEQGRLQHIKALITGEMSHYGTLARATVGRLQQSGVQLGSEAAQAQLSATVPASVSWSFGVPLPSAMHHLVSATQPGSPLSDLFTPFGHDAAEAASQALITGISTGMSPSAIAPLIQQALDVPRWKALSISRTETLRSYRSAQLENFRANDDVVDGWIWIAALVNSCAACIAMHGTFHSLDETMDEHVNGACTQVPHTKDWSEILAGTGIDTSDLEDTSISVQSGADWFDEQDEATQRNILGNAKYDAWNHGDFSLNDLVGHSHDPDWGGAIYEKPLKELV